MTGSDNSSRPGVPADFNPVAEARFLLRCTRAGALATLDSANGTPFVSLVNVATAYDGSPLLLLSKLAAHRTNIEANNHVSLLLASTGKGDPLAHARLTVSGRAELTHDAQARQRFLTRNPKSALYADFPDFNFFHMTMTAGHLNGGFARAASLSPAQLLCDCSSAANLIDGEQAIIEHVNSKHAADIRHLATRLSGTRDAPWRLTGIDPEGLDLAYADQTMRLVFQQPVETPAEFHRYLAQLMQQTDKSNNKAP